MPKTQKMSDRVELKTITMPIRKIYHQKARRLALADGKYPGLFMKMLLENAIDEFEKTKIVPNPIAQRN
jgi:hypothetical protein